MKVHKDYEIIAPAAFKVLNVLKDKIDMLEFELMYRDLTYTIKYGRSVTHLRNLLQDIEIRMLDWWGHTRNFNGIFGYNTRDVFEQFFKEKGLTFETLKKKRED